MDSIKPDDSAAWLRLRVGPLVRLAARCRMEGDCIVWLGAQNGNGYGVIAINRKNQYVHRVTYQMFVGEIPPGMDIDHLCRNRRCINPSHLEATTHRENVWRGNSPKIVIARSGICGAGLHELSGDNVMIQARGYRRCRECARASWRNRSRRRREQLAENRAAA